MASRAEQYILDFKASGWKMPDLYERLLELASDSAEAFLFCKSFLQNFEKGATIFDDALSYIEKEQFAKLIVLALDILKNKQSNLPVNLPWIMNYLTAWKMF